MKSLLLLFILSTLFISCINDSTQPDKDPSTVTIIEQIKIPFKEYGYSQHASKVISSQAELDRFLTQVGNDENWNNKTDFLATLQDTPIDFSTQNLLFYRITEGSGSIQLSIKNENIFINNNEINIEIERSIPEVLTADMAYYGLVYKVSKEVKTIIFENGQQTVIIENKESDMIVPKNCKAWFDGCNYCSQTEEGKKSCTTMECLAYRPQDFRCTKWEK